MGLHDRLLIQFSEDPRSAPGFSTQHLLLDNQLQDITMRVKRKELPLMLEEIRVCIDSQSCKRTSINCF